MSWPAAAAIIGADAIGSIFNQSAVNSQKHENRMAQSRNTEAQKEFAQNGVRWRVEDARRAGISPLAALGAQTHSYSPTEVGSVADTSMGDLMSRTGQNIGRAIAAGSTKEERAMQAYQVASAKLDLEGKEIDNAIKAFQLNQLGASAPALPSGNDNFMPGQGNSGLVIEQPLKKTVSQPGRPAQEAGWRPDVSFSRTDTGLTPMVPETLSESLEDDIIGKAFWRIRNQLVPNLTGSGAPSDSQLPAGADTWKWSHSKQEWQPARHSEHLRDKKEYYIETPKERAFRKSPWKGGK